jgi:hypothetical protein
MVDSVAVPSASSFAMSLSSEYDFPNEVEDQRDKHHSSDFAQEALAPDQVFQCGFHDVRMGVGKAIIRSCPSM